jgi:hypothetical protein
MTDWLPQNPEIKTLMGSCARTRLSDNLSGVVVDLFEVEARAKARYLLQSIAKGTHTEGG